MCLVGCPLLSHQNQHFGDYYKKATVRLENIIQPEFRLLFKSVFDIECRFYYRFYLPRSAERQNENDLKVPYWYCGNPTYLKYWYCGNPTYPHQLYMASTMPTKYGTQIWSAIFLLILLISHRPTSITYICATRVDAFACVIFTPPTSTLWGSSKVTWFNQFRLFGGRYKALICDSIQCLAILSSQCWKRRSFENWSQFLSRVGIPSADCKIVEKCWKSTNRNRKVQTLGFLG